MILVLMIQSTLGTRWGIYRVSHYSIALKYRVLGTEYGVLRTEYFVQSTELGSSRAYVPSPLATRKRSYR